MDQSYFMMVENEAKIIRNFMDSVNLDLQRSPYTPNTFTLWRQVSMSRLKDNLNSSLHNGYINAMDQIKLMRVFVDQVDNGLFYEFKCRAMKTHLQNTKTEKDAYIASIEYYADQKQIIDILENNLKKEQDNLLEAFSIWQIEIEYAFDLLSRVDLYELVQIKSKIELSALVQLKQMKSVNGSSLSFYDKAMGCLISNIETITSDKVKEVSSTGWIKGNMVETGKSLMLQMYKKGSVGLQVLGGSNSYLFMAGLLVRPLIKVVGSKAMTNSLREKINKMTMTLKEINIQLDSLIWKSFEQSQIEQFEEMKEAVNFFVQKYFSVNVESNKKYCQSSDSFIQVDDLDDFVMVSEIKPNILESIKYDNGAVVNQKMVVVNDYIKQ